jgi:hypothetical protein
MPDDGVFIGPCVQIYMKRPAKGGMYENVYLRQLGGRDFLAGKLAPIDASDRRAGLEVWCAVEHVQMLIHFPDVAAAQDYWLGYMRETQARKAKKRSWWQVW